MNNSNKFHHLYHDDVIRKLETQLAKITKRVLNLAEKYFDKYNGECGSINEYKKIEELCKEKNILIGSVFDAVKAKKLLEENEICAKENENNFKHIKEFMVDFLKSNLSIEVDEDSFGFNGRSLNIKLVLGEDTISEGMYTLKEDEG